MRLSCASPAATPRPLLNPRSEAARRGDRTADAPNREKYDAQFFAEY